MGASHSPPPKKFRPVLQQMFICAFELKNSPQPQAEDKINEFLANTKFFEKMGRLWGPLEWRYDEGLPALYLNTRKPLTEDERKNVLDMCALYLRTIVLFADYDNLYEHV